jgi:hypothetical protein
MIPCCIPKLLDDIRICMKLFIFPSTAIPDGPKKRAKSFVSTNPTISLNANATAEKERTRYKC